MIHLPWMKYPLGGVSFYYNKDINLFLMFLHLSHLHSPHFQRKTEKGDESVCVVVVVQLSSCEGCQGLAVQRIWGSGSSFDDIAFIQFEFDLTGHILLG